MNNLTSNQLTGGLNTDIHPKFQDDGTYRFALNSVLETREGDYSGIANELGNSICAELPYGTRIIGHALTDNEEIILFLFHRSVSNPPHQIGIYNPITCKYTTIAQSPDLNFSDQHQINAFVRIRNGCERVVYFTDNYNPYRVANLTDTSDWITPNTTNIIDVAKIKYSRDYIHPSVTLDVNSTEFGGSLLVGTYNFAARYIDSEGNATNWMEITRPVAISDDSVKLLENDSSYCQYDGGTNVVEDVGYVVKTNKSISLVYSDIDTRFNFFQIAVIKYTSEEGAISGVDVLTKQPIQANSLNFVYTGIDSQIEYQTSIEEILSDNVVIDKVKTHTHLDSRLFLGNITNTSVDYTGFQRHASRIKVEYVKVRGNDVARKAKQPNYYFGDASFLADEVYALGIVYVFKNGTTSPVFHIPGRRADDNVVGTHPYINSFTNWDTDNIPSDINVYNTAKTKRWQVYNTATKYATPSVGQDVEGLMGYYETTSTYPQVDNDCDTHPDGFWGVDHYGELIVPGVTKIRHHRMPAHELELTDIINVTDIYKTGVKFTMNLAYPHPDIIGHYFVHSDRTFEKTIVDKGIVIPAKQNRDSGVQSIYAALLSNRRGGANIMTEVTRVNEDEASVFLYISPKTTLEDTYSIGSYLRLERYITAAKVQSLILTPTSEREDKVLNGQFVRSIETKSYETFPKFNYGIEWNAFLNKSYADANAVTITVPSTGKSLQNLSVHNNWLAIVPDEILPIVGYANEMTEFFAPNTKFSQVSLKIDIDVFNDLSQIAYKRIGNTIHKKTGTTPSIVTSYAGDVFISNFNLVDYVYARNGSGDVFFTGDALYSTIESELAFDFRHGSDKFSNEYSYYKFNPDDPSPLIPFVEYVAEKYYEPVKDESSYFYPETYLLNKAFNNLSSPNRYYGFPSDYEFCNDCLENFPYRIYYSELDDAEQSRDNYRVIRQLNYQDLSGSTGELNDLFVNFSKLMAITDLSPYYVPTRPQQLTTETSSIYIGTSEVFGVPPQQLKVTDYHFGGSKLFKGRVTTEYGTFYIDEFNGRPFMIENQLSDISLNGLRNFWQENGQLYFAKQFFQRSGKKYTNFSTSSDTGIGYISTYDPRFKRIIVHKKDYKYIANFPLVFQDTKPTTESVWYNGKFFFYVPGGVPNLQKIISFDDPEFFENKSFTLSYSFLTKKWISFHSYLPYYLFNNYLGYFSTNFDDTYIYKHLEGNHTNYYGKYYPHIIDLIALSNPNFESQFNNVMFSSTTQMFDTVTKHFKNVPETFNEAIIYNSKQSTGKRPLKIKDSYFETDYDPLIVLLSKTDNKYRASNIRDAVLDEDLPLWDSSWNTIQSTPYSFIDKLPNESNIDLLKSEYDKARMKDYYLGIRLISNPTQDIKMVTDIVNTLNVNRNR